MDPHHRHTQPGWVIVGVAAAVLALAWRGLPPGVPSWPLFLVVAFVGLAFGSLTAEVDAEAIRLRFGIGIVRKRIPLAEVKGWREVRNPWYTGWGIRLGPGYVLWNVSGFDAVELDFASGRRFRVGTDEPAALVAAIERAKGEAAAFPAADGPRLEPSGGVAWKGWAIALLLGVALVGGLFWSQMRPPRVSVSPGGIEIETLFYGTTLPADDISAISLEPKLPRIHMRTNGFAAGGTLRGHFRVEGLGDGRLYVDVTEPPFVLVRLRRGYVFVNFSDPELTRALYEELARAWPDRVTTGAP